MKHPGGRPTKYDPETMLPTIVELMGEGASLVEVAAELGISRETIDDWTNEESPRYKKEFSDTIKYGVSISAAWWERNGRKNLHNKDFQYVGWYMNMKNRFGWRDKTEQDNKSSDGSMSPVPMIVAPELVAGFADYLKQGTQAKNEPNP